MKKAAPWIFLLFLAGGFTAWYLLQRPAPESHPSVVALPEVREPTPRPRAEFPLVSEAPGVAAESVPLPLLAQSDEEVSEALAGLVGAERLGSVVILEQIINRIAATVDSLDSRQVAPLIWPVRPADGKFLVLGDETPQIHPDNSKRYEPYISLVEAIDVDRAAEFYRRHYPLFQEAYEQLGYEDRYFNDRVVAIIDHLLSTPATPANMELVQAESVFLFVDERMEKLSAGQKMLLRINAEQRRKVERKLRLLREILAGSSRSGM